MKSTAIVVTVILSALPLRAQALSPAAALPRAARAASGLQAAATSPAKTQADQDVLYEGELETYIAVGRETTGWRLRIRTPEGRRRFIEVLLTAEVAQGVRANTRVQVRGTMQMRHYAERGDVEVLVAKTVIEVARR